MVDMGLGGGGGGSPSPSSQQYCLKWNNHQNNLLRVFLRLLGQEQFTDVTVASEGRRIKCHKVVLSACSSYFEHLFMSYNEPNQIVILKDTPYQDIAAIIEFMYKGEINVSQDRLSSLLKTAENLKVKGLAEVSGSDEKKTPTKTTNNNNSYPASNGLPEASASLQTRPQLTSRLGAPPPMQMLGRPVAGGLESLLNGDVKRKRGRPRTLDGPEDLVSAFSPKLASVQGSLASLNPLLLGSAGSTAAAVVAAQAAAVVAAQAAAASNASAARESAASLSADEPPTKQVRPPSVSIGQSMSPLQAALNRPLNEVSSNNLGSTNKTDPSSPKQQQQDSNSNASTPASPRPPSTSSIKKERDEGPDSEGDREGGKEVTGISPEKLASWGIIKMNDYLVTGTRQQYWEELFVKHVMEAVRCKEIDMKGAAELLGVSYGTLYGRYRENFGYLKHAWNLTGRPQRKQNIWTDPTTSGVLEAMRSGTMSMKQAAEALGMEPAMLAYHLAAKVDPVPTVGVPGGYSDEDIGEEELDDDEDGAGIIIGGHEDPDGEVSELMEIQPEIIVNEGSVATNRT